MSEKLRMLWKNKMLHTLRDWFDAAMQCSESETHLFTNLTIQSFGWSEEQFASTLGYLTGYCDQATLDKCIKLFNVEHPIFGKVLPGPDEAFTMGRLIGELIKDKKS